MTAESEATEAVKATPADATKVVDLDDTKNAEETVAEGIAGSTVPGWFFSTLVWSIARLHIYCDCIFIRLFAYILEEIREKIGKLLQQFTEGVEGVCHSAIEAHIFQNAGSDVSAYLKKSLSILYKIKFVEGFSALLSEDFKQVGVQFESVGAYFIAKKHLKLSFKYSFLQLDIADVSEDVVKKIEEQVEAALSSEPKEFDIDALKITA